VSVEEGRVGLPGDIPEVGSLYLPPGEEGGVPDFSPDGQARLKALWPDAPAWRVVSGVWGTRGVRVIAVAHAASPRAGALALEEIAFALAAVEQEILVVDLDLDRPTFPKPFQYQPDEGIVDMALYGTSAGAALRKTPNDRVRVVTVGSPPIAASEVYASKELEEIMAGFRSEWDAVLLHVPLLVEGRAVCPALRLADVVLLVSEAPIPTRSVAAEIAAFSPGPRVLGLLRTRSTAADPAGAGGAVPAAAPAAGPSTPAAAPAPSAAAPRVPPGPPPRPPVPPGAPVPPPPAGAKPAAPAAAKPPAPAAPPVPPRPAPVLAPAPAPVASAQAPVTAERAAPAAPLAPRIPAKRRGPAWILVFVLLAAGAALAIGWGLARMAGRRAESPRVTTGRGRAEGGATATQPSATSTPTRQAPGDTVRLAAPDTAPSGGAAPESPASGPPASQRAAADSSGGPQAAADSARPTLVPNPQVMSAAAKAYGIQVASHPSRTTAAADSAAWARKGQIVTIVAKDIPEKGGVWYRVVLGRYSGRDEAKAFAEMLRAAEGLEAAAVVVLPAR
jgi:hypothetical protein